MPDSLPSPAASTRGLSLDGAVENPCHSGPQASAPLHHASHGPPPRPGEDQPVCLRQTPRQATSAVAYEGAEPEEDDPLLGFAPYIHPAPRSNSITPERQRRFVATLAATGIVNQAARSIGKSMEALYKLRAKPGAEGFAAAWDEALERGMQRLEDCALERSLNGTPTPIVSGGKILGTWDKPDNNLLRFMLQHRRSGRYGVQNIQPGHPVYESIRAEVMKEVEERFTLSPRTLADECDIIASINAKIDAMRAKARPWELLREFAETTMALEDMGLDPREVLAVPCSTLMYEEEEDEYRRLHNMALRRSVYQEVAERTPPPWMTERREGARLD